MEAATKLLKSTTKATIATTTTTTTTLPTTSDSTFCSPTTGSKIFLSVCPLLLAFGTCTNILSLLVLTRKRMRKHSTYLYLAILSIIDMLALYLGLIRDYLAHGYGIYISTTWLCRLHSFLFYYTLDFSSWILVAVSIDRFLAITFVFSSYTRQLLLKLLAKPKLICFIIGSCLFFLNLHFFFYIEFKTVTTAATASTTAFMTTTTTTLNSRLIKRNSTNKKYNNNSLTNNKNFDKKIDYIDKFFSIGVSGEYLNCAINEIKHPIYAKFFQNTWPYIDLSVYAILPFCIMSICNIAIIKNAKFSLPSANTNVKSTTSLNATTTTAVNTTCMNNNANLRGSATLKKSKYGHIKQLLCSCCCCRDVDDDDDDSSNKSNNRKKFPLSRFGNKNLCKKKATNGGNNIDYDDDNSDNTNHNGHSNGGINLTHMNKTPQTAIIFTPTTALTSNNQAQSRNIRMMTLTIIAITCIFIVLTLPIMLFIVIEKITTSTIMEGNLDGHGHLNGTVGSNYLILDPNCKSVIWSILNIFMYINHSINFVLYCLTGSKFRTELATLFVSPQVLVQHAHVEQSPYSTSFRNFSSVRYSSIKIPPPPANYVALRSQSIFGGNTKL